MLLPDCKCRSGFFAVIRLQPFSLPLLPPLFCRLFAGFLPALSPDSAGRPMPSRAVLCCPVSPRVAPVPGVQSGWGPCERPLQHSVAAALLPYHTCYAAYAASSREILRGGAPGNLAGVDPGNPVGMLTREILRALARKILRGCLSGVFYMGARDPRVARLPGRQARTFTGYGFGRRRVSAPRFPTDALRFRLFSKGILPAATVSCTRNCGGRSPASSW